MAEEISLEDVELLSKDTKSQIDYLSNQFTKLNEMMKEDTMKMEERFQELFWLLGKETQNEKEKEVGDSCHGVRISSNFNSPAATQLHASHSISKDNSDIRIDKNKEKVDKSSSKRNEIGEVTDLKKAINPLQSSIHINQDITGNFINTQNFDSSFFEANNTKDWSRRYPKCFQVFHVEANQNIALVLVNMDGKTGSCFLDYQEGKIFIQWQELFEEMPIWVEYLNPGNRVGFLNTLVQIGVDEYDSSHIHRFPPLTLIQAWFLVMHDRAYEDYHTLRQHLIHPIRTYTTDKHSGIQSIYYTTKMYFYGAEMKLVRSLHLIFFSSKPLFRSCRRNGGRVESRE
ncbi:hypothetical protein FRX31_012187 [Thalictrum thalictroides]|uniref:Uncharacterized protein n=1 Tax=Thalictrum thalictroides TaxID=46969 RepID=A0A7J6WMN9_THATH|nr:hypothetical protein FRX31_012187 [Thalictrum thalictroides]